MHILHALTCAPLLRTCGTAGCIVLKSGVLLEDRWLFVLRVMFVVHLNVYKSVHPFSVSQKTAGRNAVEFGACRGPTRSTGVTCSTDVTSGVRLHVRSTEQ